MKFRKRPVVIEAIQINNNIHEIKEFIGNRGNVDINDCGYKAGVCAPQIIVNIETLEGTIQASNDDYIIKGVKGEIYTCKSGIFENTYEKVEG